MGSSRRTRYDARRREVWRAQRDRPWLARRARALLAFVAMSIGVTTALVATAAFTGARPDGRLVRPPPGVFVAAVVVAALFGASITLAARSRRGVGWPKDLARNSLEVPDRIRARVDVLALAVGLYRPEVVVLDTDAVNAAVSGRGDHARLLLTRGACDLDDDLLDALLAYCMAVVSDGVLAEAQAAAASVASYTILAKILVGVAAVSFALGASFGRTRPWVPLMAASSLALAVVFVFGTITTLAAVALSQAANDLADSDAVAITMRPDMYAALLMGMADDPALTHTRASPLVWLEHATTRDSMAAVFGSHRSQAQIEHRARRICAVAGVPIPDWWS